MSPLSNWAIYECICRLSSISSSHFSTNTTPLIAWLPLLASLEPLFSKRSYFLWKASYLRYKVSRCLESSEVWTYTIAMDFWQASTAGKLSLLSKFKAIFRLPHPIQWHQVLVNCLSFSKLKPTRKPDNAARMEGRLIYKYAISPALWR